MTTDDALNFIVSLLRSPGTPLAHGGYDVYTENAIALYQVDREMMDRNTGSGYPFRDRGIELSPLFLSALWELCRRGVLRPGLCDTAHSGVGQNVFGAGYSITPQGKSWLEHADYEGLASVIPGRFVDLLSSHERRFGPAFVRRGAEAVRCYSAHAFLACCTMCGAAAESVVLALALERNPESEVWKIYSSAGGRARLVKRLTSGVPESSQREFNGFAALMTYWRDEAAHGKQSAISETEAFTSLMLLLRFSRYADDLFS